MPPRQRGGSALPAASNGFGNKLQQAPPKRMGGPALPQDPELYKLDTIRQEDWDAIHSTLDNLGSNSSNGQKLDAGLGVVGPAPAQQIFPHLDDDDDDDDFAAEEILNDEVVFDPPGDGERALMCLEHDNLLRNVCQTISRHWMFDNFILLVIVTNCVFLAYDDYDAHRTAVITKRRQDMMDVAE